MKEVEKQDTDIKQALKIHKKEATTKVLSDEG